MCALLLPGNISPLRSQIVLPSVSVSSVLILLKKSSQQTIKTLDLTLHHSSSPLDSWYPFSQIWYYELETVLVSSCEIKNTLFQNTKVSHFNSWKSPSIFWDFHYHPKLVWTSDKTIWSSLRLQCCKTRLSMPIFKHSVMRARCFLALLCQELYNSIVVTTVTTSGYEVTLPS